jgi:two-component system, cell cycle response regulator
MPEDRNPKTERLLRTTVIRTKAPTLRDGERMPVLVVLRGAQVGRRYLLNEPSLVVGRSAERAQLVVSGDPQVSSVHCLVEQSRDGGAWEIADLASTNGTFLGERRVERAPLVDRDRIVLGATILEFTFHDELEAEFHQRVDRLMNVDDLTGLPVQRVYQQRLQECLAVCASEKKPFSVFMMDLDGLKRLNDTHGHLVGERSIAETGRRLGAIVRDAGGVVSRFGGDEFSACVPGLCAIAAAQLGERMRAAVGEQPVQSGSLTVQPTMSIGFAVAEDGSSTAESLTRRADEALYRAKAAGRNCVRS